MSKTFKTILCVIGGIIGFYVLLYFTLRTPKEKCSRISFKQSLEMVANQMYQYGQKHDGEYPDKLSKLYHPMYVLEIKDFFYPHEKEEIITPENIDSLGCFEIVGGLTSQTVDLKLVIVREKSNNHWEVQGRYEALADGSVRWTGKPLPRPR